MCQEVLKKDGRVEMEGSDRLRLNPNKNTHLDELLRLHNDKNVILEGYTLVSQTGFRRRYPYIMCEGDYQYDGKVKSLQEADLQGLGYSRFLNIAFKYDEIEQFQSRIRNRGGKMMSCDSASWKDNHIAIHYNTKYKEEGVVFTEDHQELLFDYDAKVETVQDEWLKFVMIAQ